MTVLRCWRVVLFPQFNKQKLEGEVFFLKADWKSAEQRKRTRESLSLKSERHHKTKMNQDAASCPQKTAKLFSQARRYYESSNAPCKDSHTETSAAPSPVSRNYSRRFNSPWAGLCCQSNAALQRSFWRSHWGQTGGKQVGKSPATQLLPAGKRQGGLGAPRAAGLRTGGK